MSIVIFKEVEKNHFLEKKLKNENEGFDVNRLDTGHSQL